MIVLTNFDEIKQDLKDLLLGLSIVLLYFIMSYSVRVPLVILGIDIDAMSNTAKTIYSICYEASILAIIIALIHKELFKNWQDFKKNKQTYFQKYFKYWFLLLGLMMISNFIVMSITQNGIAENEQTIRDMMQTNPIYIYISGVLIAPFLEELVFRFGLRKIFKTDTLFIIISGLVFGALHVVTTDPELIDYLYIIPYAIPGFIFAYIYTRSKNIFTTICMHFFHNGLLVCIQLLTMFF